MRRLLDRWWLAIVVGVAIGLIPMTLLRSNPLAAAAIAVAVGAATGIVARYVFPRV